MAGLLGSTPAIVISAGVGAATAAALAPAIEVPKQQAWASNPTRILDAATMARLVAQGGVTLDAAHDDGTRDGYSHDKIDALVYLSQTVPAVSEAMGLWRRGLMSDALFQHVLTKSGLDQRYVPGIVANKLAEPLDPAVIANAIVRGIVQAPFALPYQPPAGTGKVAAFPSSPIDAAAEVAQSGVSVDRLFVETAIAGRPMAPEEAAKASFRGIIETVDYHRAIAEGDIRSEWRDAIYEYTRQILTAHDYVELHLRGWIDQATMYAGTALHGMSTADTDLMFKVLGRPIPVHQVTTGEARGGVYDGPTDAIPAPFLKSMQESNSRPEWYNLEYANRYSLPGAFVIRALLKDGAIDAAQGEQLFLEEAWPPWLAKLTADHYAAPASAAPSPHVKSSQTSLVTAVRKAYVGGAITQAQATTALLAAGEPASSTAQLFTLWDAQRVVETTPPPSTAVV